MNLTTALLRATAIASVLLAGCGAASAQDANPYVSAQFVSSRFDTQNEREHLLGGDLGAGLSLNRYAAIELTYIDFGRKSINTSVAGFTGDFGAMGGSLTVLGRYPVAAGFSVLGRVGIARIRTKAVVTITGVATASDIESKNGPTFGAGLRYELSKQWAANLEVNRYQAEVSSTASRINALSAGLQYAF